MRLIEIELPGAKAVFTTRAAGSMREQPDRDAIEAELGVRLAFVRQVHGARVIRLAVPAESPAEADGQATALRAMAPAVLTADCLPIALAADGAVAMLHAGWRGLAAGVIEEGVSALREVGGRGPISAAIGPGAGPCCYEVGEEVLRAFDKPGPYLDLKAIARARLEHAGAHAVQDVGLCTICSSPELFFSHRRDQGVTGRQAGIAWLT